LANKNNIKSVIVKLGDSPVVQMFHEILNGTDLRQTQYWINNPDSQMLDNLYEYEKLELLRLALHEGKQFALPINLGFLCKHILIDGHHRGALMHIAGVKQIECYVVFWQTTTNRN
jgi:hypothetical protein